MLVRRTHGETQALIDVITKNYKEIKIINLEDEKKLKALEIIKKKKVGQYQNEYNGKWYFTCANDYGLTKEENELLKEVLL